MDPNIITVQHVHDMGYWCVIRDQHNNIVCNGNSFLIQNTHTNEIRYLDDTPENRQYLQLTDPAPTVLELAPDIPTDTVEKIPKTKEVNLFWDKVKIKLLLTLCLENKLKNPNPNAKEKNLWNEIAPVIGTTPEHCAKEYRNLRRTYVRLLKKKQQGRDIKWIYYNICDEVFHDSRMLSASSIELWEDNKVKELLTLYIENLSRFRDPDCLKKDIWNEIAQAVGTTDYNCYHKFKNLKRTYFKWQEKSKQTGKAIKWQFYHYFERIFYNYSPSVGPWDRNKIKLLLGAYLGLAQKFRNPKFQKKDLWKEIAAVVKETPNNCDRKFRNLKQTYIKLKSKAESGNGITKWRFYKDFEDIYSRKQNLTTEETGSPVSKDTILNRYLDEDYVKELLSFYISNLAKFRDPLVKKKSLWRQIAPKLGISPDDCDRKFRNLKQTYIRLSEKRSGASKCKWPYFSFFEQIYNSGSYQHDNGDTAPREDEDNVSLSYIKKDTEERRQAEENVKFDRLVSAVEVSNDIQRQRNRILLMLLRNNNKI